MQAEPSQGTIQISRVEAALAHFPHQRIGFRCMPPRPVDDMKEHIKFGYDVFRRWSITAFAEKMNRM